MNQVRTDRFRGSRRASAGRLATSLVALGSLLGATLGPAHAQTVVGYQLGAEQSVGTTVGEDLENQTLDNQQDLIARDNLLLEAGLRPPFDALNPQNLDPNAEIATTDVSPLQAVQITTSVFGGVSFDRPGSLVSQGLVLNGNFSQLIPVGVDADDPNAAGLQERITIGLASATYIARIDQIRWQLAFTGGYTLNLNGRLANGADGSVRGQQAVEDPSFSAGAFAFNGVSHTFNSSFGWGLVRARWDTLLNVEYLYTADGVFALSTGALGQRGQPATVGTNLGAFAAASVHSVSPSFEFRRSVGLGGLFTLGLGANYNVSERPEDDVRIEGLNTIVSRAVTAPPETALYTALLQFDWRTRWGRRFGGRLESFFSQRRPTIADDITIPGEVFGPDALSYGARAFYQDTLPWQLQLDVSAGASQAHIFQPPLGVVVFDLESFENIRSSWEPVGRLELSRRFDPITAQFALSRELEAGVFGTSAIISESGSLTFVYLSNLASRRGIIGDVGFNFTRFRGVGRDQFQFAAVPNLTNANLLAGSNNTGFGANIGLTLPLFRERQFTVELRFSYIFNWIDTDPEDFLTPIAANIDCLALSPTYVQNNGGNMDQACAALEQEVRRRENNATLEPVITQVGLLTIRGTWGRGVADARRRANNANLDAYVRNPQDGSPLVTSRLQTQGSPLFERGDRPGEPTQESFFSNQQEQQQELEDQQTAREQSGAVLGIGSTDEEAERAARREEEEEERQREQETLNSPGAWPLKLRPPPNAP